MSPSYVFLERSKIKSLPPLAGGKLCNRLFTCFIHFQRNFKDLSEKACADWKQLSKNFPQYHMFNLMQSEDTEQRLILPCTSCHGETETNVTAANTLLYDFELFCHDVADVIQRTWRSSHATGIYNFYDSFIRAVGNPSFAKATSHFPNKVMSVSYTHLTLPTKA